MPRYDTKAKRRMNPCWWGVANLLLHSGRVVGIYMYVQGVVDQRQREARLVPLLQGVWPARDTPA
jgi:hypothetical protein